MEICRQKGSQSVSAETSFPFLHPGAVGGSLPTIIAITQNFTTAMTSGQSNRGLWQDTMTSMSTMPRSRNIWATLLITTTTR